MSTIRETPDIIERLRAIRSRVGRMCREGSSPLMSVPVSADDDDIFICTAVETAADLIAILRSRAEKAEAKLAAISSPDDAMVERGARALYRERGYGDLGLANKMYWAACQRDARACLTEVFRVAREGE